MPPPQFVEPDVPVDPDRLAPTIDEYVPSLEPVAELLQQALDTHHPAEGFPGKSTGGGAARARVPQWCQGRFEVFI
jgi:hypothetical protein